MKRPAGVPAVHVGRERDGAHLASSDLAHDLVVVLDPLRMVQELALRLDRIRSKLNKDEPMRPVRERARGQHERERRGRKSSRERERAGRTMRAS